MANISRQQLQDRSLILQAIREGQGIVESGLLDLLEFYLLEEAERDAMDAVGTPLSKDNPVVSSADTQKVYDVPRWPEHKFWLPEAYLDFEGDFQDKGGGGIHGTPAGATPPSLDTENALLGTSSMKSQPDGYLSLGDKAKRTIQMDNRHPWTIMFELKVPSNPASAISLVIRWDSIRSSNSASAWVAKAKAIDLTTTGALSWESHGSPGVTLLTGLSNNTKTHIALVRDPSDSAQGDDKIAVYKNGIFQALVAIALPDSNPEHVVDVAFNTNASGLTLWVDNFIALAQPVSAEYIAQVGNGQRADTGGLSNI